MLVAATLAVAGCVTPQTDSAPGAQVVERKTDLDALQTAYADFDEAADLYAAAAVAASDESEKLVLDSLATSRRELADVSRTLIIERAGVPDVTASTGFSKAAGFGEDEAVTVWQVMAGGLGGEEYLIESLRGYLADPAVSIEAKTFFQEALPGLREERMVLAGAVAELPENYADAVAVVPEEPETDEPAEEEEVTEEPVEGDGTVQGEPAPDLDEEEPGDSSGA